MKHKHLNASIIVCTYNRANSLKETLQALHAQLVASDLHWEVIIVDNNSNDDTRAIVAHAQKDWPRLKYKFESKQGLSYARNLGVSSAQGEIILFTDDDVLPETDWLEKTLSGMKKNDADACGGFIAPIWEASPPDWLTEKFHGFLAVRTESDNDYFITASSQAPFGANMAFKRSVFDKVGLFDTNRGRKGDVLASGEDGEMFERVLAAKLPIIFLGKSRVHHKVEKFRLTKQYFRRWRFQASKNIAQSKGIPGKRLLFGVPPYIFIQLLRAISRAVKAKLYEPKDSAFLKEIIIWHFLGIIAGAWRKV